MIPVFAINELDFSDYTEDIQLTLNDMDAEGSGRDITTGIMYRNLVTVKDSVVVNFLPLPEHVMAALMTELNQAFVSLIFVHPLTNTMKEGEYYCATKPCGAQKYNRGKQMIEYTGVSLTFTER